MGGRASKDELVYAAVQGGDLASIRALRQQGASLEHKDARGRTPLMLACSRAECFDAARTLLQLGADINASAKGMEGGAPIHFAARRRLTRTLKMLLNYGADPLQRNDAGKTALDIARDFNSAPLVRLMEGHVGVFAGLLRQHWMSNTLVRMFLPQWVSRIVWVCVLPVARHSSELQLAIYTSPEEGTPLWVRSLKDKVITLAKQDTLNPRCIIQDCSPGGQGEKLKFGSEPPNQAALVLRFCNACNGFAPGAAAPAQPHPPLGYPAPVQPGHSYAQPQPYSQGYLYLYPYPYPHPQPQTQQQQQQQQHPQAFPQARPQTAPHAQQGSSRQTAAMPPAAGAAVGAGAGVSLDNMRSLQGEVDEEAALRIALEDSMRTAPPGTPLPDYNGWAFPRLDPVKPPSLVAGAALHQRQHSLGGWAHPTAALASASAPMPDADAARLRRTVSEAQPALPERPVPHAHPASGDGRGALESWADSRPTPAAMGSYAGWGPPARPPPAVRAPGRGGASLAQSRGALTDAAPANGADARSGSGAGPGLVDMPLSAAPSAPPAPDSSIMYPSINSAPLHLAVDQTPPSSASVLASGQALPAEVNSAYSEVRVKEELAKSEASRGTGGQCVICWDAPAHAVCIPCGHIAGCVDCLTEVQHKSWGCPVCRAGIQSVIKVFQV